MITTKKIMEMARKWQSRATNRNRNRKKRISWRTTQEKVKAEGCSSNTATKGHFVVYSIDQRRFVLPLIYLNTEIFKELFNLAEEEFGLSSNVPLTLPCEGTVIEYVTMLIQRNITKDLEQAVLMSITIASHCQSPLYLFQQPSNQHWLVYAF